MKNKDFVATVYVIKDGKVLLVHHKIMDMWLPPGGHINEKENPTEAAIREVKEETGFDVELIGEERNLGSIKILKQPFAIQLENIPPDSRRKEEHHHVDFIYLAKITGGTLKHNKEESNDIKWFSKKDMDKNSIQDLVRHFGEIAIGKLK